ncbi:hypothetical protein KUCAC02_030973 [Chaenocephalus aceratus]|uniref:Uncharacterized protein n=1 Tax=Chaenocephalus aceratus TaxID=36190 RepID=A0ACB9XL53_CHAAC|nr:hypothetical protein KUCAC02_030973 [Chaenocephalus aceratus]
MIHPFSHSRSSLQSVRDSISNQVSAEVHLYEQNADILDLLTVTERSATGPSVSDMMGWLHDAERHFRQQFPRRKTVLQTLRPDDLSLLESAPKRWTSLECPSAGDHIRGLPAVKRTKPTHRQGPIVRNPKILLDEAPSALDTESEQIVQSAYFIWSQQVLLAARRRKDERITTIYFEWVL